MFVYITIKNALPAEKDNASPEMVNGWARVAHAWLDHTTESPAEIDRAFEQLAAEGTIVVSEAAATTKGDE
jgi:hypothetical protein